jgi:hypothetical protein
MTAEPPSPLAREEYRALRAVIRQRGTARFFVALITFVAWGALVLVIQATGLVPVLTLVPLIVLAAGFEAAFALQVGVERIGRYIQVHYESELRPPRWEHLAMSPAPALARSRIDPLFTWLFLGAAALNLVGATLSIASLGGPTAGPGLSPELALHSLFHALFAGRLLTARRFARRQRQDDLAFFQTSTSTDADPR